MCINWRRSSLDNMKRYLNTPVAPWEDYAEGVYEDFMMNGEYKLFIE
jgi:hypothetical protein